MDDIHQVLLIEPDAAARNDMVAALEKDDLVVLEAGSAKAGIELASRREPEVAVICVSVLVDGVEKTVAALRAASPGLRAVFLSTQQDPEETRRLAALGAVLRKPVEKARLLQAVQHALRFQQMSAGVEALRASTGRYSMPSLSPEPPPDKPGNKS